VELESIMSDYDALDTRIEREFEFYLDAYRWCRLQGLDHVACIVRVALREWVVIV
jgi:hypothetical protein